MMSFPNLKYFKALLIKLCFIPSNAFLQNLQIYNIPGISFSLTSGPKLMGGGGGGGGICLSI